MSEIRRNITAVLSVGASLFAPLMFGLALSFAGPAVETMRDNVKKNDVPQPIYAESDLKVFSYGETSTYGSIITIGAMVGALAGGPLTEYLGRKSTLIVMSPVFVCAWAWTALAKTMIQLMISRCLIGMGVGVCSFVAPVYIGEISPTSLRGALGAGNQLAVTVGIMLAYLIGLACRSSSYPSGFPVCSDGDGLVAGVSCEPSFINGSTFCNWRLVAWLLVIPSGLLGVCMLFVPESPKWLLLKGRTEAARAALNRLRGGEAPPSELEALEKEAVEVSSRASQPFIDWSFVYRCRLQLFIGITLQIVQQLSGINAVMVYQTTIFQAANMDNSDLMAVTVMIVQVLITFVAVVLMDRAGRRVLFIAGTIGMAVSAILMGIFFINKSPSWLALFSAYAYIVSFSIGVGAIPWLILAEIFPDQIRGLASSLATVVNWGGGFVVTKFLDPAVSATSYTAVFWFFAVTCMLGTAFAFLMVPETKGKSFDEIQRYFDRKQGYEVGSTSEPRDVEDGAPGKPAVAV